jgi:F420-dependent methylenetetrahydromethanopterin dehydrogenase
MVSLTLYVIFFAIVAVIGWRLRQRRGRIGSAAVGSVYDMLNEERRKAIEVIVEEKAAERDPEHADDVVRKSVDADTVWMDGSNTGHSSRPSGDR